MASSSVAVDGAGEKRSTGKCLYYLRNIATFLVSHIGLVSLVVGYCIMGAFTFEALEAKHELQVKREMVRVRESVTDDLWRFTYKMDVLVQEDWTTNVTDRLKKFETHLIESMKKKGWDGSEETDKVQWTLAGALFYSIILITTIGREFYVSFHSFCDAPAQGDKRRSEKEIVAAVGGGTHPISLALFLSSRATPRSEKRHKKNPVGRSVGKPAKHCTLFDRAIVMTSTITNKMKSWSTSCTTRGDPVRGVYSNVCIIFPLFV